MTNPTNSVRYVSVTYSQTASDPRYLSNLLQPEVLIRIGLIASYRLTNGRRCIVALSHHPDLATIRKLPTEPDEPIITEQIPLQWYQDGDLHWSMGYSEKLAILCVHLPAMLPQFPGKPCSSPNTEEPDNAP